MWHVGQHRVGCAGFHLEKARVEGGEKLVVDRLLRRVLRVTGPFVKHKVLLPLDLPFSKDACEKADRERNREADATVASSNSILLSIDPSPYSHSPQSCDRPSSSINCSSLPNDGTRQLPTTEARGAPSSSRHLSVLIRRLYGIHLVTG